MEWNLRRIAGRAARSLVFIAASVYAGLCALIYGFQEKLIFRPAPLPESHAFAIADTTEVMVRVDGAELSALHFRLPNPTGLVFFLHGNGGNLASWLTSTDFYRRANYDLFMIDYRG
ncbi:MAG TPA: hypothetical protein VFV17_09870, partial [Usitatibacteraceae bacterium]|nr:hypothetical protein [Usitatibacteraceae bacterium]